MTPQKAIETLRYYAGRYLEETKEDFDCGMSSIDDEELEIMAKDVNSATRALEKYIAKPKKKGTL